MATTAKLWHAQFVDDTGTPQAGVKVYHYEAGTTTDKDVYRDPGKTTTDTQPVIGDSSGFVKFYGDGTYRLRIVSSTNILLYDIDSIEISGANTGTSGRVLFYGSNGAITDDDDLTWDSTNKRLGVGTTTNITENVVMKPGGFLAAERTGAGSNEGAKRLIGLNSSNKVSIDPQGQGTVFENLPVSGLLYLDANGQLQVLTLQNGMLPIGSTGAVPVAALPIADSGNVAITPGPGSLTLGINAINVLDRTVSTLTHELSSNEVAVYSFVVPGGTMGTNKTLKVSLIGEYINNSGANRTFTFKIKFGGTTIFEDATLNITTNAAGRVVYFEYEITNLTVSSQYGIGHLNLGQATAATTGTGDLGVAGDFLDAVIQTQNTAINTAINQTFSVTVTHSNVDTYFYRYVATAMII